MYADGYVGSAEDSSRIRRMGKKRDQEKAEYDKAQKQRQERLDTAGLRKFGASSTEALEHAFKNETIGLVTKAEFVQKRTTLQERLEEEMKKKLEEEEALTLKDKERRRNEKLAGAGKPKLSFMVDDEEGEQEGGEEAQVKQPAFSFKLPGGTAPPASSSGTAPPASSSDREPPKSEGEEQDKSESAAPKKARFGKFGKDPSVATAFLPDRDRERAEEDMRNTLRKEWIASQEALKSETLDITYSYWDGSGHRRKITVKKGDSIGTFLKAVRDQLSTSFKELRAVSVDNLMYIKEDLVMPQHMSFYDLIVSKARGKSGPLFDFGVHDDIRLVNDATQEKTDSHAGKVVERHWYDRNKHIFPANRWEPYDPDKVWDSYTIHDYKEKH